LIRNLERGRIRRKIRLLPRPRQRGEINSLSGGADRSIALQNRPYLYPYPLVFSMTLLRRGGGESSHHPQGKFNSLSRGAGAGQRSRGGGSLNHSEEVSATRNRKREVVRYRVMGWASAKITRPYVSQHHSLLHNQVLGTVKICTTHCDSALASYLLSFISWCQHRRLWSAAFSLHMLRSVAETTGCAEKSGAGVGGADEDKR
jgi:hypothetical protein